MSIFKKKQPKENRTRRPVDTGSRPITSSYSYRTSRSEATDNVGRNINRPDEPKPAQKSLIRAIFQKFGLLILLIVAVVSLISFLIVSPSVKVVNLGQDISTGGVHSQQEYANYANTLVKSSILNSNKITINTTAINQSLIKKYPELASANVSLSLFARRPTLYIDTSNQALVLLSPNGTYLINERGKAVALVENPQAAAGADLAIVNDLSGIPTGINKQVLSSKYVHFIETVYKQLKAKGYNPSVMTLPANSSELDVTLEGQPYMVKFNLRSNTAREQVGTFLATISKLKSQSITPSQYVDVRVDGRAYYL